MIGYYKYYIRTLPTGEIVHSFSDAFEQPQEGDILVAESPERCWSLIIKDMNGCYNYKWDGNKIVERTIQEKQTDAAYISGEDSKVKAKLLDIDMQSIRSIREWMVNQPDCPSILKTHEANAQAERYLCCNFKSG